MFAPVIGAAYTMTTKREAHWFEQAKAQNTEKGMCVGLKQPRGDGERYVTPVRAAAEETIGQTVNNRSDLNFCDLTNIRINIHCAYMFLQRFPILPYGIYCFQHQFLFPRFKLFK